MTKTEIEYEEAPSGSVTFYNYKEPLMKFDNGFGYVGALVFDTKTDKIQCHFCGQWITAMGNHLSREHSMTASQYKDKVGLLQSTALVSESTRAKMIKGKVGKIGNNLKRGYKQTKDSKRNISKGLIASSKTAEWKNLKGTCPAQLLDRIIKIHKEKGKDFVMKDFSSNLCEMLKQTFGSVQHACERAGIPYNKVGRSKKKFHILMEDSPQDLIKYLKDFKNIHGRLPSQSDCKRNLIPSLEKYKFIFGSWKQALLEAFN